LVVAGRRVEADLEGAVDGEGPGGAEPQVQRGGLRRAVLRADLQGPERVDGEAAGHGPGEGQLAAVPENQAGRGVSDAEAEEEEREGGGVDREVVAALVPDARLVGDDAAGAHLEQQVAGGADVAVEGDAGPPGAAVERDAGDEVDGAGEADAAGGRGD